ncbi:MAG: hypothetical protein WCO28_10580 [Bacteroidota bacterium]
MGNYKRKLSRGERWFYSGQHLGIKYFSKAIYLTKQECQRAERERLKELDQESRCPSRDMLLKTLLEERLDYIKLKKSIDYYKENKRYFKKLLAHCGNVQVSSITRQLINRLAMDEAERLLDEGKSNYKVNSMIRSLKALFNYGINTLELTIKNPCQRLEFYPIDIKLKYIPTNEEINAVRSILSQKQRLLFDFVEETGCRIMEAIRLEAKDVDLNKVVLYTRKAKNSNLTPRIIPRPSCLIGTFEGRVFDEWTAYPRFLEDIANGWNFHNLRHRRASIWARDNMPIFEIMSRLGHNNTVTTMRYLQMLNFTGL